MEEHIKMLQRCKILMPLLKKQKKTYQDIATTKIQKERESVSCGCRKILRLISRRWSQDPETLQDTDTRFCPHFHEGHQNLATSQQYAPQSKHISSAFPNMALQPHYGPIASWRDQSELCAFDWMLQKNQYINIPSLQTVKSIVRCF